jgi:hypothetical protein
VLRAVLEELTNWISKTRLQSASLFRTIIVYCEEHLVSEFHGILPHLYKVSIVAEGFRDRQDRREPPYACGWQYIQ